MALEFEKVMPQVNAMGSSVARRSVTIEHQTQTAGDLLMNLNDLNAIWQKILIARQKDAGFRGAAPFDEPINQAFTLPTPPDIATLLAADGSQIYPDPHAAALYWLTNIGVFVYPHGSEGVPECITEPRLYYDDQDIRDSDGRLVANAMINAQRSVAEMQMLAQQTLLRRHAARPLISIYDGPLVNIAAADDSTNHNKLAFDYHEAIERLFEVGAGLCGYIDRPNSTFVVKMLHLMTLDPDQITRHTLHASGELEGLADRDLYQWILPPGTRSGMMIQQSPLNKAYKEGYGDSHEIVFFYMNVAAQHQDPYLARVEIPMWVAQRKELVAAIHSLLYAQCQITDRYPYSLTRADEIAVIPAYEKRALDEMITIELLRNEQSLHPSQKLNTKGMARHGRVQHQGI